ncbi:hypothetical protein PTTG_27767 [Puccinia triticina 1-1 BBBD Race 1]|uniref:Glutaredoxin domain-containing protein n=2 Tax=Puccinia triticina TaxID=208348 RepID=A0A180GHZ9_PUCT1|nr:uncharacterized protein PtA15_18A452 [Puccinia triticina]OAV92058.1 hypothetical protein PTTG_27767 [Puccinia triticina 1-1 BBBD Race 1]WAQ93391.1 hypothetical protein PtA15_18A452 [Puccinia triticina]WAR63390.1 hypothetical protein PtB15_18B476 [Puccinia triticina]
MGVKQEVDQAIAAHAILVYSKSYCPHSRRAKRLLAGLPGKASSPVVYELDEMGEAGVATQAYLGELTGQRTVPNIFIHQKHIGGADDLAHLDEAGVLRSLVAEQPPSRLFRGMGQEGGSPLVLLGAVLILGGLGSYYYRRVRSGGQAPKQKA